MEERALWLAWSQIDGIGPTLIKRIEKEFGTLAAAWEADGAELLHVEGIGPQAVTMIRSARSQIQPEQLLAEHEQKNLSFWTPADAAYPRLLLEIPDPPPVLYYRGQVDLQENWGATPTIAVVGTRRPSDYGRWWTRRITTALIKHGFTVVSGLAEGIDTEAHRACVTAARRTVAVVGTGVDVVYPWSNRLLYQQVLQQGLVLSEYPAGTQPDRIHFPRRNRIIAGLSRAVLVMEAPERSGALITAHLANEYGRDVFVLPGVLDNPKAIGCLALVNKGAQVILGEDPLLEMLGTLPQLSARPSDHPQPIQLTLNLPAELEPVLKSLAELSQAPGVEFVHLDTVVEKLGLPAGAVSSALLQLEMMELVTQLPGMRYQLL